jgi:23S rRNA pseudouridine1911/1915/1917 synthase
MLAMRVPTGSSSISANGNTAVPAPLIRRTISTASSIVAATISTPMAIVSTFRKRIGYPRSFLSASIALSAPRMQGRARSAGRFSTVADAAAHGQRVDRFLAEAIGRLSRSRVKALIEQGSARRNGEIIAEPAEPVQPGATYVLEIPPPLPATPRPQLIPFTVVYEDCDLIVLDKPAGLVVHPAPGNEEGTLVNALLAHCGDQLRGIGGERRPGIVHRLDKDTSGLMVAAKTQRANDALTAAFATRDLDRAYLAVVWGLPNPLTGEIEGNIGRDPRERKRMALLARGGKPALTRYSTIRAWRTAAAMVECRLATGRTHQIRVHLASRGYPLIGDPIYLRRVPATARTLAEQIRRKLLDFPRQALHSARLGFNHPITGERLAFASEPPADIRELIAALEQDLQTAKG